MTRLARALGGLLLGLAVLVGASVAPAAGALPPPTDTDFGEARIHWLMNQERQARGLQQVRRHPGADMIADYSAFVNAYYGRLNHNPNLGRDILERVGPWWVVGENVGCGADADHLHAMWMRSSGHRANILRGQYDTVGVGAAYHRGCLWATVVFADLR
jgi:uncharacterized protein YkwD